MTYVDLSKAGANLLAWGNFLTILINFVLLAFIIFWMIKIINHARYPKEEAVPPTPEDVILLREIRDSLKK